MRTTAGLWLAFLFALLVPGSDEFGRGIGLTVIQALALSTTKGVVVVAVVIGGAVLISLVGYSARSNVVERAIQFFADLFDSIPSLLWVLVVVVTIAQPRQLVPLLAFTIIALPSVTRLVMVELKRVSGLDFVLASRCLGASSTSILFRHVLPNSMPLLRPLALQICGSGIAIDGAIGLLGVGNRTDLNLGTLLVRGKEQFLFSPMLLFLALFAYLVLFATLFNLLR
jgi:ABC-type dipeptide/oligopeptide/nickel transport system permease subunit